MAFYAVAKGRSIGIFDSWIECKQSVIGFKNALYKKFNTKQEAEQFIQLDIHDPIQPDYYVYTDGACSHNGKDHAKAGIGIFFGKDDPRNVSKRIVGKQTNNMAELRAIIETYPLIEPDLQHGKQIAIVSDSEYAIKCATTYGETCSKNGWSKEIPNQETVKLIYELYKDKPIQFIHVKAHTNQSDIHSLGNHQADLLANQSIGLDTCPYAK